MKSKIKFLGIIVIVAGIVFSMIGCDVLPEEESGTFTLTGIPSEYDGMFAAFYGASMYSNGPSSVIGSSDNPSIGITYVSIINRKVSIPLYVESTSQRYTIDDELRVYVTIHSSNIPSTDNEPIASWPGNANTFRFSKGSAKKTWD
jgi:hypothetical protein